jgi:hypothetical protein
MAESIRELVRYQMPGYVCIVYATLLLMPFIDLNVLEDRVFFNLLDLIIASIVSGIPLGWFLFQFYHTFFHERIGYKYAWKRPDQILKEWDKNNKTCPQDRICLMDYALLKSRLRSSAGTCWSHASSRYIIGFLVPMTAPILAIALFLLVQLTPFSNMFRYDDITLSLVKSTIIWFCFFSILFFGVFLKIPDVLDEVQHYIMFSLWEHEIEIKKLMSKKKWTQITIDEFGKMN